MTRRQVFDKYLNYEQVPGMDHVAATPESIERALDEMLKLAKEGLLLKDDGTLYSPEEVLKGEADD